MTTTPMNADQLVEALRAAGVTVVEHPGWRENVRPGDWGPMHGSMVHHTAIATDEASIRVVFEGRPDLPGPLSTGIITRDGTVHLVGSGRANHAGAGSSVVLAAVRTGAVLPAPGPDDTSGNAHFYGWEAVNRGDGTDPWPAEQFDAIVRVQAAVCRHHGWTAGHVIAHREWTARKPDPRGIDMGKLRARVAALLAAPAGVYVVRPGDTLYGIARAHGVDWDDLLRANPKLAAHPEDIQPGDEVLIPSAPSRPSAPVQAGPRYPGHYLRVGTSDRENTRVWQRRMNAVRRARLTVDGVFGPRTESATKDFQRSKGLGADGIVGPRTWRAAWN